MLLPKGTLEDPCHECGLRENVLATVCKKFGLLSAKSFTGEHEDKSVVRDELCGLNVFEIEMVSTAHDGIKMGGVDVQEVLRRGDFPENRGPETCPENGLLAEGDEVRSRAFPVLPDEGGIMGVVAFRNR
jgi:hypothetical protein